jgi:hypothetical protein
MTVNIIKFGEILKSAEINDIDAAVLRLQNIAGIDDGGVAAQCFSGFTWEEANRGDRIKQLAMWLSVEQRYEEAEQLHTIAKRFAEVLRAWLSPEEYAEMQRLNATPQYGWPICASHNFCDANMAMMEAFESVTGRMAIPDDGEMAESDCKLWGDAWDYARNEGMI